MTHAPVSEVAASSAEVAPNGWTWAVLRGYRAGEQRALTDVYRMYAADIARFLRLGFSFRSGARMHRFVGYGAGFELQDALHETFRRAFEPGTRARYDGVRPFGPYLRTIARNVVLRSFRAREVLFPTIEDGALTDAAGGPLTPIGGTPAPSPERAVHDEQIRRLVRGFLDSLDADERRIAVLRFAEGKSQRDVAAELGIGRQRVRSREARLRKRLLRYLHDQGESGLLVGALWPVALGPELLRAMTEVVR